MEDMTMHFTRSQALEKRSCLTILLNIKCMNINACELDTDYICASQHTACLRLSNDWGRPIEIT